MGLHNIHRYLVYCSLLRKGNPRCLTERSSEIITVSDMFFHVLQVTSKVVFCPAYILNVFFMKRWNSKVIKKEIYTLFPKHRAIHRTNYVNLDIIKTRHHMRVIPLDVSWMLLRLLFNAHLSFLSLCWSFTTTSVLLAGHCFTAASLHLPGPTPASWPARHAAANCSGCT